MSSKFLIRLIAVITIVAVLPLSSTAKSLEEWRAELDTKRQNLREAEEKISKYQEDIQLKKREARTLSDQIGLLNETIEQVELILSRTLAEIEETAIEIETVAEEISQMEAKIEVQKDRLAEYIRSLHTLDQQSSVTIFLKYSTFADAVNEVDTLVELQQRGQETLVAIQGLRDELENKRLNLEDFKQTLNALKTRQEKEQDNLATQRDSKENLLKITNSQEVQFQDLLQQSKAAHQASQSDIKQLDALIREELKRQGIGNLPSVGILDWPVDPIYGVSCEFHCAGYPYAYLIGAHSGIDIPANVGTPIQAPADGYIARVHNAGGPGYNYIMLIHGDNVTTVYGHVSGFAVNEGQIVTRGTIIGYSGGAPGMNGAGLSTGPHLHFEVRVNNAAVNPRNYL